ncbi:MAG: hypothetical protein GY796_20740 [Chloroflexi bacterium]|nr:hypothetical protein [Chloroflexota bacterium]
MYSKSIVKQAKSGSLWGMIIGTAVGGAFGSWSTVYAGLLLGSVLGCVTVVWRGFDTSSQK